MHDEELLGDAMSADDFFVLVVSQRSAEELEMRLGAELHAAGISAFMVRTAAHAQVFVERTAVASVMIDLELPDMNPYDLCGGFGLGSAISR